MASSSASPSSWLPMSLDKGTTLSLEGDALTFVNGGQDVEIKVSGDKLLGIGTYTFTRGGGAVARWRTIELAAGSASAPGQRAA